VLEEAGYKASNPWYFPTAAEYVSLLEQQSFEIQALWTFRRWNKLEHPERGLREWLEMFTGTWFEAVPATARGAMFAQIESRLRASLFRDNAWWADYRRLRVVARLGIKP
jgi:hypothetical protein